MRIREILKETETDLPKTNPEIYEFLKNNCMDFIKHIPRNFMLYRGKKIEKMEILSPFANRKPADNRIEIQDYFDELMKKAGCKALRSNSFFCKTKHPSGYGPVHCVFPIGSNWDVSYNDLIDDLFDWFDDPGNYVDLFVEDNEKNVETFIKTGILNRELIDKDKEENIIWNYGHGKNVLGDVQNQEIMLWCEKALFIPVTEVSVIDLEDMLILLK